MPPYMSQGQRQPYPPEPPEHVGQHLTTTSDPTAKEQEASFRYAIKAVTPTLILVGIVTGMSFALGSGVISRLVWKDHLRK